MGCFSWMFADKNNKKSLKIGHKGYILTPDNQFIRTPEGGYEGYGVFFDNNKDKKVDVYELVVDWNRSSLLKILDNVHEIITDFDAMLAMLTEKDDDVAEEFVKNEVETGRAPKYLMSDWKRCLGITIACYDEDNQSLPFPIKIVSCKNCGNYEDLPASKRDDRQGF